MEQLNFLNTGNLGVTKNKMSRTRSVIGFLLTFESAEC